MALNIDRQFPSAAVFFANKLTTLSDTPEDLLLLAKVRQQHSMPSATPQPMHQKADQVLSCIGPPTAAYHCTTACMLGVNEL